MGDPELQLAFNALSVAGVIGPSHSFRGGRNSFISGLGSNSVPIDPSVGHPYGECNSTERPGPASTVNPITRRKLYGDGFDNLREKLDLRQYIRVKFEQKLNPEDERPKGAGLDKLLAFSPNNELLAESARCLSAADFIQPKEDRNTIRKPDHERNYRDDRPQCAFLHPELGVMPPVLYRVIAQIDSHHLLCEVVFADSTLIMEMLQFVVLGSKSLEAPDFDRTGFSSNFVDVNDLVWIYDIYPFDGFEIAANEEYFLRAAYDYSASRTLFWASKAHCFLRSAEYNTAWGYVITDRGDSVITGSDEAVAIDQTGLVKYLGGIPTTGDIFRIDYVSDLDLATLKKVGGNPKFHAGFSIVLKPARRDEKVCVIAASIHTNETSAMTHPFRIPGALEAVEMQTRGYTIGKFTDAVLQQMDADAVIIPSTIQWQNEKCGKLTIKGGDANYSAFRGCKLATIVVPSVATILVKLETYKRSAKRNHCLNFTTFAADHTELQPKMKMIKRISEVNVSPIEMNPTDDILLKYMYTGNMCRHLKAHLMDQGPMNNRILTAIRQSYFMDTYDFDDSQVQRKPFVYNNQNLVLDEEQSIALEFVAKCQPRPAAVVIQACAGAGKTLCSVALMVETIRMDPNSVQFMCAPTNRAVDNMAYALSNCPEARPIRLFSKSALDKFENNEPKYSLNSVIQLMANHHKKYKLTDDEQNIVADYLKLCQQLDADSNDIAQMGDVRYHTSIDLKKRAESAVYNILVGRYRPNVILTTVDMGLRDMLSSQGSSICKQKFTRILIDEASQLDEPKLHAILSLNMSTSQLVLVGDPKQLPPYMVQSIPETLREMGGRSALDAVMGVERLPIVDLHIGYRMHYALLALTSSAFYNSSLVAAETGPWMAKQRLWKRMDIECPIMVGYVGGEENTNGTSKYNEKEAKIATALVREALAQGVKDEDIGVICLYNAQVRTVCRMLSNTAVEVSSVDSFQGREKDYVIVLTTRSTRSDYYKSFFADRRRANVATSRAILGMVILGEQIAMRNSLPWVQVTDFAERYDLIRDDLAAEFMI